MAKSSRSKWKRQHRRILASNEKKNVEARVSRLHKKLELTVQGAITSVPLQDPETRFHFVNPAVKQRTCDISPTDLNNSTVLDVRLYGVEDSSRIDFSKPLSLPPPTTSYYGKSDPNAPHPVTLNKEKMDAEAPVAGRALTKENMVWITQQAQREAERAATAGQNEEDSEDEDGPVTMSFDVSGDAPEEYVFNMEDAAPRRLAAASSGSSSAAAAAAKKTKKAAPEPAKKKAASSSSTTRVTEVSGSSKMKAINGTKGSGATRIVSSGSKAFKKASRPKK